MGPAAGLVMVSETVAAVVEGSPPASRVSAGLASAAPPAAAAGVMAAAGEAALEPVAGA